MDRDKLNKASDSEVEAIIKLIAPKIIEQVLTNLGFTIDNPTQVQQDLAYLRKLRRGAEEVKTVTIRTAVGAAISGLIYLCVSLFKSKF